LPPPETLVSRDVAAHLSCCTPPSWNTPRAPP